MPDVNTLIENEKRERLEYERQHQEHKNKVEKLVRYLYHKYRTPENINKWVDNRLTRNANGTPLVFTKRDRELYAARNHIAASLRLGISPISKYGFGPILDTEVVERCLKYKPTNKHRCGRGKCMAWQIGRGTPEWCQWVRRKDALKTREQAAELYNKLISNSLKNN